MKPQITTIIFTLNEEIHLTACLESLAWCTDIIVVDSFSTDDTERICRTAGVRFYQNAFKGFGSQRNWALERCSPENTWILILDADERVPEVLAEELAGIAGNNPADVAAYRVRRRFYIWGRWLKYSSLYPTWVVRFIHRDRVRYINRGHAETQEVKGEIRDLKNDLIDENIKGIDEWFERQNRYSRKDAEYELQCESQPLQIRNLIAREPLIRRVALKRLALRLPARSLIYFLYSYFWRRGFLDGKDGFVFCLMKAVYQQMIVIKKYDLRKRRKKANGRE